MNNDEVKIDYIRFRCTEEEKLMAKELAKKEHMSLSTYLIRLIYADAERKGIING